MKEKGKTLSKVFCIEEYSFTADFWTSCQNCLYGTVTMHYIDSDYVLLLEKKEITQAQLMWILQRRLEV